MKNAPALMKVLPEPGEGPVLPWLLGPRPRPDMMGLLRNACAALGSIFLIQLAAHFGMCRDRDAQALTPYVLAGVLVFFLLLRFELTRWAPGPPLMFARQLHSLGAVLLFYAWGGAARDMALLMLFLLPLSGLASLGYQRLRALIALSLALLALVMVADHRQNPQAPSLDLLALKFALVASAMGVLALIGRRIERLRRQLHGQKAELTRALDQVQRLGQVDALTGLFNRRHMLELMHREMNRQARGQGGTFCLAMVDLDHFKKVNDQHGHAVGDQVLRGFAQVARRALRVTDVVARWGGEEFLVLLPLTDLAEAGVTLDRLRQQMSAATLVEGLPDLRVT